MRKRKQPPQRSWLVYLIGIAALGVMAFYTYFWELNFNADQAMVGLMGKRWLVYGEVPIFVWSVGYQGLLMGGSILAVFFKLFGVGPRILALQPMLLFPFTLFFFYRFLRYYLDKNAALLSTLFFVLSTPFLYDNIFRAVPNYAETLFFGSLLFWLHTDLVKSLYFEKEEFRKAHLVKVALAGFVFGFGIYTNGLIIVFAGAAVLHFVALTLTERKPLPMPWLKRISLGLYLITAVLSIHVLRLFMIGTGAVSFLGSEVCTTAEALLVCGALFPMIRLSTWALARPFKRVVVATSLFAVGCGAGLLPKLYYDFILHGPHFGPMRLDGTIADAIRRLKYGWEGNLLYMGLHQHTVFQVVLLVVLLAIFVAFLVSQMRAAAREPERLNPVVFLPITILGAFALSIMPVDPSSSRYTLGLQLFFATALGTMIYALFRKKKFYRQALALMLVLVILGKNISLFVEASARTERPYPQAAIAEWVLEKGVHEGYGNFWYAYSTTFLTNENLIIQPYPTGYGKHYDPIVQAARRIAYVDPNEPLKIDQGIAILNDQKYRLVEENVVAGVNVQILEKL